MCQHLQLLAAVKTLDYWTSGDGDGEVFNGTRGFALSWIVHIKITRGLFSCFHSYNWLVMLQGLGCNDREERDSTSV